MTAPDTPPLPTFIIIGAQKSATRWLRSNLGKHPDIFTPDFEPSFFNTQYKMGTDFYRSQFTGWAGEPIVGEATPGYMIWKHKPPRTARRIHDTLPDVRLIAVLRDPIERANSALVHHKRRGRLRSNSKLTTVARKKKPEHDKMGVVAGGWYAASLDRYLELFGEQLLVVLHDDVREDPLWVYRTALEHVGADPSFVPESLAQVVFSNQQPERTKRDTSVSDADRRKLWPYFEDDVRRLEPMIGRDLSAWDPSDDRFRWPALPADAVAYQERAFDWVGSIVEQVPPERYDAPTPCTDWTVRELLVHMNAYLVMVVASFATPANLTEMQAAAVADDPAASFVALVRARREILADARLRRAAALVPFGMLPADVAGMLGLKDLVAHAWDLAVAIDLDATIPDDVAEPIERFTAELFAAAPAARFALEDAVEIDASAPAGDRYLALTGRDPRLIPPSATTHPSSRPSGSRP